MSIRRRIQISPLLALGGALLLAAASLSAGNYQKERDDIVATAVAAGDFSTLATALQAGDLVNTLV